MKIFRYVTPVHIRKYEFIFDIKTYRIMELNIVYIYICDNIPQVFQVKTEEVHKIPNGKMNYFFKHLPRS
jgi:hypothetical protein